MPDSSLMEVSIETRPEVEVVYSYALGPYPESAPKAWKTLFEWQKSKGLMSKTLQAIGFGMDLPSTKPAKLIRYIAAASLSEGMSPDEDAGIDVMTVPGGRYAVHRMFGTYHNMPDRFQRLLTEWLPSSGHDADFSRPFLEIYINDPSQVPEAELQTDLCVPLSD